MEGRLVTKRAAFSLIATFISGLSLSVVLAATGPTASIGAPAPRGATAAQTAPAAAASSGTVVARNAHGRVVSRLVGKTAAGNRVTGSFTPLKFSRNASGRMLVRGIVTGVTRHRGAATTFTALRTVRVATINGVPARAKGTTARAAASCDVLNLVLGPLDLNLLGLQIDLSRIVLNIVAVTGAGNLLGNLLCAVAGLLDGGLSGLLNRVIALLNQILGNLRLGG
jgi:hypothetical protein